MRIAVIGAGAVGGVIAALADRAGHEVTVTARGEHLAVIRGRGLQLSGRWGEHLARPYAAELLDATAPRPDLALLCVKAQDASSALAANATALEGVPLVVVQNGLGGAEAAAAQLPGTPVIGGLALFAASYLEPGQVSVTTGGATYLGRPASASPAGASPDSASPAGAGPDPASPTAPPSPAPASDPSAGIPDPFSLAVDTLSALMPIATTDNFTGAQWTKLLVNHVNALPAITGLPVQQTIADARLRAVLLASMRETIGIARARGVSFEPLLGLDERMLRVVHRAPRILAQLVPRAMARRMGATPNPGSTLQSIRRGQLTEIDHLNGAVVEAAADIGRKAPVNAALVALVHAVERDHRFRTPAEVTRATLAAP
ncbi:MAG: 2-dehydropantoate 2-reductase [Herbiconiux sp.]|nr:2-dehydropantoate 2-reductase [Herbiconiux sp.]